MSEDRDPRLARIEALYEEARRLDEEYNSDRLAASRAVVADRAPAIKAFREALEEFSPREAGPWFNRLLADLCGAEITIRRWLEGEG